MNLIFTQRHLLLLWSPSVALKNNVKASPDGLFYGSTTLLILWVYYKDRFVGLKSSISGSLYVTLDLKALVCGRKDIVFGIERRYFILLNK